MNINKKVLSIIISLMFILSILSLITFIYNFKKLSVKIATAQAISIAQNVRDGLTAHMINETMDKRAFFLNNIAKNQKIENFHLLRAQSVIEQYNAGFYTESRSSKIEKKVLKSAKIQSQLIETFDSAILKISIPYIATSDQNPNCLSCHKAKLGDVLGVISMDISIDEIRKDGISIAFKILLVVLLILILSIFVARFYILPYLKLFNDLENGISRAYKGDFSYHIETALESEAGKVASRLNELSEIYKFKKTIELDENKETIYNRIVHIVQTKFDITKFIMFEINNKTKLRNIIFDTVDLNSVLLDNNASVCRAFRINEDVYSNDFDDICLNCLQKAQCYICLNFTINDDFSIVLHIQESKEKDIEKIKNLIPIIKNYFEMAKPVIETKILMNILKETTLRDPMTSLYNRRFLNELLNSNFASRVKDGFSHAFLMMDIDFFKSVNDTYGHDVGDEVIKRLALIMKESVRGSDISVRYGGEEFLILLNCTIQKKAVKLAQDIRKEFEEEKFVGNSKIFSKTLSIGIAYYPNDADTLNETLKHSDEALYEAKSTGRNKVVEFKSLKT